MGSFEFTKRCEADMKGTPKMEYELRAFILADGKIKRIGVSRLSRIHYDAVPEDAGQKIPYALLVFEREEGKLGDLRYREGGHLVFDKEGKLDESKGLNHLRLVQAGENDPKSFAARRAEAGPAGKYMVSQWRPTKSNDRPGETNKVAVLNSSQRLPNRNGPVQFHSKDYFPDCILGSMLRISSKVIV
jgi:hypothetical protein